MFNRIIEYYSRYFEELFGIIKRIGEKVFLIFTSAQDRMESLSALGALIFAIVIIVLLIVFYNIFIAGDYGFNDYSTGETFVMYTIGSIDGDSILKFIVAAIVVVSLIVLGCDYSFLKTSYGLGTWSCIWRVVLKAVLRIIFSVAATLIAYFVSGGILSGILTVPFVIMNMIATLFKKMISFITHEEVSFDFKEVCHDIYESVFMVMMLLEALPAVAFFILLNVIPIVMCSHL